MKKIELTQVPVKFIENRAEGLHKYLMGLTELVGVTTILKDVIFRDKYTGIDEDVLRNAANRGTAIHEAIQAFMTGRSLELAEDLQPYMADALAAREAWTSDSERLFMTALDVEYLISDCKEVATKIDVVTENEDGTVDLADIKTTYQLDEEYLSWQLSVEKFLFERQNPAVRVGRLMVYWYNRRERTWTIKQIPDKGTIEVERLLAAWRAGEFWGLPSQGPDSIPAPLLSIANMYADMEADLKAATEKRDKFRDQMLAKMQEYGIKQVKTEGFTCTYVEATERESMDTKKMLAEHPELADLYKDYRKVSQVKPSVRITLK